MKNQAFIDAQNLYLSSTTADIPWRIDLRRFRVYLKQKYHVNEAYYFFGAYEPDYRDMYTSIQECGYVLMFREHGPKLTGKKKGNVDTDIVFTIMKKLYRKEDFDKVVLVSGDGDYKRMVDFLIQEDRFEKLLLPSKKYASSLYKSLTTKYFDYLDRPDMQQKLALGQKEKGS